jgi:hypothetical protein
MARWTVKPPVERVRNGYRLNLDDEERDVLVRMIGELRTLLVGPSDHELLRRIFPTAYHRPENAEHDEEYQRLMREDLVASRLSAMAVVDEALAGKGTLDEPGVIAFMQSLNALRLVLGTMLDVTEDLDLDDLAEDDPQLWEHHLYGFLSWLLEWTVRALSPDA